jgi:vancomycin resistance protein VanW
VVAALACVIGGSTLALGVGLAQGEPDDKIASGVLIDGLDLGGKTRAEAAPLLHALAERKLTAPLLLNAAKLSAKTTAKELGGQCDEEAALETAFSVGHSESWVERLRDRIQGAGGGNNLSLPVSFDTDRCTAALKRIARRAEQPPVEPRAREEGGKLVVAAGRPGRLLDADATADRISAALRDPAWNRDLTAALGNEAAPPEATPRARPVSLNLVLREVAPRVTEEAARDTQSLLASFSTNFSLRDRNRVHNIRLAAQSISGRFLLPGDEFSYNAAVGPRQRRAGFRTAPEIVNGELVPGIGGGVCQVSTTLYNAALLADLQVTRRFHHRFPVHYVPAGRDATVSDGGLDLRLRNGFDAPVALLLSVEGARIRARVFGSERCKRSVKLLTSRLRPAYTKSGGKRVALMRVVEANGREIRRETISRDSYEPAPSSQRAKRPSPLPSRGEGQGSEGRKAKGEGRNPTG